MDTKWPFKSVVVRVFSKVLSRWKKLWSRRRRKKLASAVRESYMGVWLHAPWKNFEIWAS